MDRSVEGETLSGIRVLVVDDEVDAGLFLDAMLSQSGAEVRICTSAAEGLQTLIRWSPDVLLSDISMPGEDGYTFIRNIRALGTAQGGAIPAAAVTAYTRPEDRSRAIEAGYQEHIPKPICEPAELIRTVMSLCGRMCSTARASSIESEYRNF